MPHTMVITVTMVTVKSKAIVPSLLHPFQTLVATKIEHISPIIHHKQHKQRQERSRDVVEVQEVHLRRGVRIVCHGCPFAILDSSRQIRHAYHSSKDLPPPGCKRGGATITRGGERNNSSNYYRAKPSGPRRGNGSPGLK